MKKIKSFEVDHRKLDEGFYISRIDGDIITYDLRFCKPNTGTVVDMVSMHTIEHMLATFTRNSKAAEDVVYFGPMGCQTGFYFLVRDSVKPEEALEIIKDALKKTIAHDGAVFGASEIECGNYRNLDLAKAKPWCERYLAALENVTNIMNYDEVNKM
ncbi:MAG: S-ribosylhomocysteine lyase [Oscillospiraceae bacterium]|nr:S-ribosylhomocysteine lyase [Oscillospiraceae bacterium]